MLNKLSNKGRMSNGRLSPAIVVRGPPPRSCAGRRPAFLRLVRPRASFSRTILTGPPCRLAPSDNGCRTVVARVARLWRDGPKARSHRPKAVVLRFITRLLWLTLAFAAPLFLSASEPALNRPPILEETRRVLNRGYQMSTRKSFLDIASFHMRSGQPRRARRVLAYALLHDPEDLELMILLGEASLAAGLAEEASFYAGQAVQRGDDPMGRGARLQQLAEARIAETTGGPGPGADGRREAASDGGGEPPEPLETPRETGAVEEEETVTLEEGARALRVARALEAAIRSHDLGRRKDDKLQKLDLQLLKKERLVPPTLDLEAYPDISYSPDEGVITMGDLGTSQELENWLGDYPVLMARAGSLVQSGATTEASYLLRELNETYPGEPGIQRRLVHVLQRLGKYAEALSLVRGQVESAPDDPQLAYLEALLMFRSGNAHDAARTARKVAKRFAGTYHGKLAAALAAVAESESATLDLLQDLQDSLNER